MRIELKSVKSLKAVILYSILFVLLACSGEQKTDDHSGHDHAQEEAATKYTCPMHPQVVRDEPGTCPICGMDLVPVNKIDESANDLMLSDSQMKLANITTEKVKLRPVGQTLVINGRLTSNEQSREIISSRAEGRIEKLFIKETGRYVKKGEPLYELYSETLLTLQQEYLLAKDQYEGLGKSEPRYESFLKAAERKLLLYGLTKQQIDKLSQSKILEPRTIFVSPASGIVTEISVVEGQYLNEGSTLYNVEDITNLWLEAELYPQEAKFIKVGDKIEARITGYESMSLEATVNFINPEFKASTQILIMRASVKNTDQRLKPGMQAQILFTHSSKQAIAVPTDAVIRNGKGTHVYVQTAENTFSPRMVKTGLEDFQQVEITDGLMENEVVAVTGAYLLYSEIVLKKGTDPMAGHNH